MKIENFEIPIFSPAKLATAHVAPRVKAQIQKKSADVLELAAGGTSFQHIDFSFLRTKTNGVLCVVR